MVTSIPDDRWYLALDVGTSSTRALVFDARGNLLPEYGAQAAYPLHVDHSGRAELDPAEVLSRLAQCVDAVMQAAGPRAHRIAAVGACTLWHSLLGLDAQGAAVTPIYTWADRRASGAAHRLAATLDEAQVHARTGCRLHSSYLPAKLAWLHESTPDVWRRVRHWVSPGDYLYWRLFGTRATAIGMASASGLLDQHTSAWSPEMLAAAEIGEEALFPLADLDEPAMGLRPEWARRWPALARVPWVLPIGDGAAGNLGSGCADARSAALNLGTSGALRVLWPAATLTIPPELWCYRVSRTHALMGAAFSDGGQVYAWLRRTLQLPAEEETERALAQRAPGSTGVVFLPYLSGERSMNWRPGARASFHGVTLATTPLDLLQAAMEGVAARFGLACRVLERSFPDLRKVVASGGALGHSPTWTGWIVASLARSCLLAEQAETSARGAAWCAAAVAEGEDLWDPWPAAGKTVSPNIKVINAMKQIAKTQHESDE